MPKEFARKRGGRRAGKKEKDEDAGEQEAVVEQRQQHQQDAQPEAGPSSHGPIAAIGGSALPDQSELFQRDGGAADGGGAFDPAAPFGFVDPDIKAYFRTVDERLREWESIGLAPGEEGETELEDRVNFLSASLSELRNLELRLATDPDTALIMERLLHSMGDWGRRVLADSFTGHWPTLLSHRFGSHVAQTLFALAAETIDREASGIWPKQHKEQEQRSEELREEQGTLRTMTQLLVDICGEVARPLPSLLINTFASPPLRLLLVVMSRGRAVEPEQGAVAASAADQRIRSKKSSKFRKNHQAGNMKSVLGGATGAAEEQGSGAPGAKGKGKERRVPDVLVATRKQLRHDLTKRMSAAEWRAMGVENVGGPAVQILLDFEAEDGACEEPGSILDGLTGGLGREAEGESPIAGDFVPTLLRDTTGSHLLQAMLSSAPRRIFDLLWDTYFVGNLGRLASHPIGNFVVSSGIKRLDKKRMMGLIDEVRKAGAANFIRTSRTAALQALVEKSKQDGELQPEVVRLIVDACEIPEKDAEKRLLLPCILTMNLAKQYIRVVDGGEPEDAGDAAPGTAEDAAPHGWKPRQPKREKQPLEPSMQGSLLLQGLFKLSSPASDIVIESLLAQGVPAIVRMSHHPISSHVIDAAVSSSSIAPKLKRRLLLSLDGHWFELVDDRFGSRVGEKIWDSADGFMKEKIAKSLIPQAFALGNSQYGRFFAKRLDLHLLQRRPDEWREKQIQVVHHWKIQDAAREALEAQQHGQGKAPTATQPQVKTEAPHTAALEFSDKKEEKKKRKRSSEEDVVAGGDAAAKPNQEIDELFAPVLKDKKQKKKKSRDD